MGEKQKKAWEMIKAQKAFMFEVTWVGLAFYQSCFGTEEHRNQMRQEYEKALVSRDEAKARMLAAEAAYKNTK